MRSRRHRLGGPGSDYHVFTRGLDRKPLFHDDRDRHTYLLILADVLRETGTGCFAVALMRNHVHHGLQCIETPVSDVMHRVNLRWALYHNRRHGGVGHVFQGRFRSILIEDEEHLLAELAYVHLNPVRAGLVADEAALRHYPWAGHAALLGNVRMDFLDVDRVLGWFGGTRVEARRALSSFVAGVRAADGDENGRSSPTASREAAMTRLTRRDAEDLSARHVKAVLGTSQRIDRVLLGRDFLVGCRLRLVREGWTLERLLSRVCALFRVRRSRVRAGGRQRSQTRARALFLHLATVYLGAARRTAARLGGVTGAAAPQACARGAAIAEEDGFLPSQVFDAPWIDEGESATGSKV